MDNQVMILKNRVKNIISRYLWKAVKPVLLTFFALLDNNGSGNTYTSFNFWCSS